MSERQNGLSAVALTIFGGLGLAVLVAAGSIAWKSKADASDVIRLEAKIDQLRLAICYDRRDAPGCGNR